MQLPAPPPAVARAGLRALKSIAVADGEFRDIERRLIEAVKRHALHLDDDVDALEPISPQELAAAVTEEPFRKRIVGGCALLTLIDGDAADDERDLVTAYANALGVKDKTLKAIKHYAKGQMRLLRFDVARRFVAAERVKREVREHGFLALFHVLRDVLRKREDTAMARRYRALGELPDGTLGKEYVRFIRDNGFCLPGEVGAAPELIVFHDAHHVLADYGTSPEEESQIAAFHAGQNREDPFGMLLFSIMQFQLGVVITPSAEGFRDMVDPELLARAFVRGGKVRGDLIRDWDPRGHFGRSVADLRRELNFVPRDPL